MNCNDYTGLFPDVLGTLGLSVDTVLKKRGGPSGIDWEKDFESLDQHKAWTSNVVRVWNDIFFPNTTLASRLSSGALELSNNAPEEVGGEEGADT